jgi:hypothetical protein
MTKASQNIVPKRNRLTPTVVLAVAVGLAVVLLTQGAKIQTFLGGVGVPGSNEGTELRLHLDPELHLIEPYAVNMSQDIPIQVTFKQHKNVSLSAVDAVLHFDPAYVKVKEVPKVQKFKHAIKAEFDNVAGTVTLAVGQPFPGLLLPSDNWEDILATVIFVPQKVGTAQFTIDFGSGSNQLSHSVITDDNGAPIDILQNATNIQVAINDYPPILLSADVLSPTRGLLNNDTRTPVRVTGKYFGKDSVVSLNDAVGTRYPFTPTYVSSNGTELIFSIPKNFQGATGVYALGVTSNGQTGYKKNSNNQPNFNAFFLAPVTPDSEKYYPSITSASPTVFTADIDSQQNIIVSGTRFTYKNGTVDYYVNSGQIISGGHQYSLSNIVVNPSGTQITAKLPTRLESGTYDLQVGYNNNVVTNGTVDTLEDAVVVGNQPRIESISPTTTSTDYSKNAFIQLSGGNFGIDKTKVTVNLIGQQTIPLEIASISDNYIGAFVREKIGPGVYAVVVSVNSISQSKENALTITSPLQPRLLSVDPSVLESGYANPVKMSVLGENIQQANSILLRGTLQDHSAPFVLRDSDGINATIEATVPSNLPVGAYNLHITMSNGQTVDYENALNIKPASPTPLVTNIQPNNVVDGYSNSPVVIISGSNFGASPIVTLVGSQTYSLTNTQVTDTQITGTIPNGMAIGKYKISVTSKGKTGNMDNAFEVKDKPAPTITSVTPSTLEITYPDNTPVTIIGTNFRSNSKVKLIGPAEYELRNPTVNAEFTQIQAQLPSGIQPGTYKIAVYSDGGPIATAEIVFIVTQTPQKVMAPIVTNLSDPKWSTKLSASWTLPIGSSAPQYYQYRILDNGNEIRAWDYDKIQLATSVTAKGLTLMNGHIYTLQVRGVNSAGPGDITTSTTVTTRSANLDYDPNEKVGLNDLQLLGRSMGRKDKPMGDINQNGIVSIDDLGILLTLWNP